MPQEERRVVVIGHKNPDTDSICSAICYAELKNKISPLHYEARRQGHISRETSYVLDTFGVEPPRYCADVYPKVRDVEYRKMPGVAGETTVRKAWLTMRDESIDTLPVVSEDKMLQGLVTIKDLAKASMDVLDVEILAKSHVSYRSILDTLNATLLVGDPDTVIEKGSISLGVSSEETLGQTVKKGDIVITPNRLESQLTCIEKQAGLIICCMTDKVGNTVQHLARETHTAVMVTPYDPYAAAKLISQCAPVRYYMSSENLNKFTTVTPISDVEKVMGKVRHSYFPILDEEGRYQGLISRRNVLSMQRRQLVLVDHNETSQTVEGYDQAEILEIIDHHRVADLQTGGPIYFRNQPVGCTCTIITQMYEENDVEISRPIAGLLLGAILSDTLKFSSPTCTPLDVVTAKKLAKIAQVDIDAFAAGMFEAGENLTGKTAEDLMTQDYKVFMCGERRFGVAQCSYMTASNREEAARLVRAALQRQLEKQGVEDCYVLLTDIPNKSSLVLAAGSNAAEMLREGFGAHLTEEGVELAGVVSRKKQFIPALMGAYQNL